MRPDMLARLADSKPLTATEVRAVFDRLLAARTTEPDRVALLRAASARSPRSTELAEFAREMRRRARPFPVDSTDRAVDLCGSGGAPCPSFNVSTVSAFVVAASGVPVVKHGNRSARGPCGSSDLLLALGLPVDRSPEFARASYRRYRLAFLHAPLFHPATRAVAEARRTLGGPTIFNRLGPLSNPAHPTTQLVGVGDPPTTRVVSDALRRLGVRRGLSMSSWEGCDEFSPREPTSGVRWGSDDTHRFSVRPSRYLEAEDQRGDWGPLAPADAASEAERLLAGGSGARRGSVLLTSGAAIWVAGRANDLASGVDRARESLDRGWAEELLRHLRELAADYPIDGAG